MSFILIAVVLFTFSCEEDNPTPTPIIPPSTLEYPINASVLDGDSYNDVIDSVSAVLPMRNGESFFLVGGKYKNGGFSIILPELVPDSCLEPVFDLYLPKPNAVMPRDTLIITDSAALISPMPVKFLAYKDGQLVGHFLHKGDREDDELSDGVYLYSNKPVRVLGKGSVHDDTEIYELNLIYRKGWSIRRIICASSCVMEVETGSRMSWHFFKH